MPHRLPLGSVVFAGYTLVSFVYFGLPLLFEPGSQYVGKGKDATIFIWSFAWWPHAILRGENPFFSHAVWAPVGYNLAWATSVPGLALLFAPLTLTVGPVGAYNVAAILLPAAAAWTAFVLCRYLTGSVWASLVGGYLFGFSSYVVQRAGLGQLHMTSVFLLPLIVLIVLRFLDGDLTGTGVILRLGPLLAFQILLSTEVLFTLSLALGAALACCFVFVSSRRERIRRLLPCLGGAYVVAAVLTEPFLYYVFAGAGSTGLGQQTFPADIANYFVPTDWGLVAGDSASAIATSFPDMTRGQEAYIGLPTLVIVGLALWGWRRRELGRFLLACLILALIAPLGAHASIFGHRIVALPWDVVRSAPFFKAVQTARFAIYLELLTGVVVALWIARRPLGTLRSLLPVLAVLSIAADPIAGAWATTTNVPAFFTDSAYRTCLDPGEIVLPLPIGQGSAMIWQADSNFRFDIAGGYISATPPALFTKPAGMAYISGGSHLGSQQAGIVRAFIARAHVAAVVLEQDEAPFFSDALAGLATPKLVGGVFLYRLDGIAPSC